MIAWHLAGNLRSRFTAFLTEAGEKPWRNREDEFTARVVSREELNVHWNAGWAAPYEAIGTLTDAELQRTVIIRGQLLQVHDALHRSLAHASYHVGQIVSLAHTHQGAAWAYLSIPSGGSAACNAAPSKETPGAQIAQLRGGQIAGSEKPAVRPCVAADRAFTDCGRLLAALAGRTLLKGPAAERERHADATTFRGS